MTDDSLARDSLPSKAPSKPPQFVSLAIPIYPDLEAKHSGDWEKIKAELRGESGRKLKLPPSAPQTSFEALSLEEQEEDANEREPDEDPNPPSDSPVQGPELPDPGRDTLPLSVPGRPRSGDTEPEQE